MMGDNRNDGHLNMSSKRAQGKSAAGHYPDQQQIVPTQRSKSSSMMQNDNSQAKQ